MAPGDWEGEGKALVTVAPEILVRLFYVLTMLVVMGIYTYDRTS